MAILGEAVEKSYSIAVARDNLAAIVHEVEGTSGVELTRGGKPVAVLIAVEEYRRLARDKTDFWGSYTDFRRRVDLGQPDIGPETFENLRDRSPGREIDLRG